MKEDSLKSVEIDNKAYRKTNTLIPEGWDFIIKPLEEQLDSIEKPKTVFKEQEYF